MEFEPIANIKINGKNAQSLEQMENLSEGFRKGYSTMLKNLDDLMTTLCGKHKIGLPLTLTTTMQKTE